MMKIKSHLDNWTAAMWNLAFYFAGRWQAPDVTRWNPIGKQTVLIIAPHPDDESIGCAGTMLNHQQAGDTVHLLVVTDGGRSRALGLSHAEMAQRRQTEAKVVAAKLGVQLNWLGLPEGEWTAEQLRPILKAKLMQIAPDYIYLPSYIDFHPEHRRIAHEIAIVLAEDSLIRIYQVQTPFTAVLTNLIVDVTKWSGQISDTLDVYKTQQGSMGHAMRLRRYAAHYYGTGSHVEEFWQMTGFQYRQLHKDLPDNQPIFFRGLRYRSFTDPLAYLSGKSTRRYFANLI